MIRCQITDGSAHRNEDRWLSALNRDVDFIQIREQELEAGALASLVRRALTAGPKILVNDRADVALATGAAGVHLRDHSISPARLRRIAPPGFLITVAVHGEHDPVLCEGADYLVVAPVFRPLSKQDTREPLGLEKLRQLAVRSRIPILALGGVTEENAPLCVAAGAAGVAGITLLRR